MTTTHDDVMLDKFAEGSSSPPPLATPPSYTPTPARRCEVRYQTIFACLSVLAPPLTCLLAIVPSSDINDAGGVMKAANSFYQSAGSLTVAAFFVVVGSSFWTILLLMPKLVHVWTLQVLSLQLRESNILVSFSNYGASQWTGSKSYLFHIALVVASAAMVAAKNDSTTAMTIMLQLAYTYPKGFELLLKRPEARLDGYFVTAENNPLTVIPECVLRAAMLELMKLPEREATSERLAEVCLRMNEEYTIEQKKQTPPERAWAWTHLLPYMKDLDAGAGPLNPFTYAYRIWCTKKGKFTRIASPLFVTITNEVILPATAVWNISILLQNSQLLLMFAYGVAALSSLGGGAE